MMEIHDIDMIAASRLECGEKLQEAAGMYPNALRLFQLILMTHPHCTEAMENARMTADAMKADNSEKVGRKEVVEPERCGTEEYYY